MKATSLALLAALLIPAATGCFRAHGSRCHSGHCGGAPGGAYGASQGSAYGPGGYPPGSASGMAGPASATVTYPYYTTRGPRDFLMSDPPSIGP